RLAACFLNASKSNDCFSVMSICVCFKVTKLQTDTLFATLSIWLLVLYVTDSQPGSNKWGPNPNEISAHSVN
ncbi:MAG: hypothetical protein ACK4E8_10785, partial [Lacibacter sp.]